MTGFTCLNGACTCRGDKIVCNIGGAPSCVDDASACATCLPPEPVFEYTCRGSLQPQALNNSNGCSTSTLCGDGEGAFCNSTDELTWKSGFFATNFCDCDPPPGLCGTVAFCAWPDRLLCYETCCDRNGTVNIRGRSLATCNPSVPCRCGGTDDLYLFGGAVPATIDASTALAFNQPAVDYSAECTVGQCFLLCENVGVILTDTVSSTLTYTSLTPCPEGTDEVSRRIASCGGMPNGK